MGRPPAATPTTRAKPGSSGRADIGHIADITDGANVPGMSATAPAGRAVASEGEGDASLEAANKAGTTTRTGRPTVPQFSGIPAPTGAAAGQAAAAGRSPAHASAPSPTAASVKCASQSDNSARHCAVVAASVSHWVPLSTAGVVATLQPEAVAEKTHLHLATRTTGEERNDRRVSVGRRNGRGDGHNSHVSPVSHRAPWEGDSEVSKTEWIRNVHRSSRRVIIQI